MRCHVCDLVFVPPWQFVSAEAEKRRYDLHRNSPEDQGYRSFLNRIFIPMQKCLPPASCGLDFGSGPEPVLSMMFEEAGHCMTTFDYFYENVPSVLERQYDFITATEVVEHLHNPGEELEKLWACLKQGGRLGIMTKLVPDPDAFSCWHYKNDTTHVCFFSQATFQWLALRWDADMTFADKDVVLFHKKTVSPRQGLSFQQAKHVGNPSFKKDSRQAGMTEMVAPWQDHEKLQVKMKTLSILYQDKHLVAVNKPSGLLVHRSMIDRHETENAMRTLRDQLGQWVWPLHRLDKPTSGVLLFALDRETARLMAQSFSEGKASKHYLAIVRGFTKELECIDYPLKDLWDKMTDQKTTRDKPEKVSVTQYRRLATVELPHPVGRYCTARYSLIKVTPLTGRNRQIRRHMKHIFHPVVGDTTYGDGKQNDFFRKNFNCRRLLLHAKEIEFIHPYSERRIHIQAPLDQTFVSLLEALQWNRVGLS